MNSKTGINFFLLMIAIISGSRLFRHFDPQQMSFEKPALDTVYLIAFVLAIVFLIRSIRKPSENQ